MCSFLKSGEDALSERLFESTVHALELYSVFLGKSLGLYDALRRRPLDAAGLAAEAGIDRRYAREWLEQQAVAGFLTLVAESEDPEARRYALPPAHAAVLQDPDAPAHVAPFAQMVAGIGGVLGDVVDAYRSGGGVPYERYGRAFQDGQGGINRPAFQRELCGSWLPSLPELHERLRAEPGLAVADVGCGQGWSAIAVAEAYPRARVLGIDLDAASIEAARRLAEERGSRARFAAMDAAGLAAEGPFDLILLLEALHDMSRPHEVLRALREALAPGGVVLVADERVAEEFGPDGDLLERMMFGWSVTHCLPVSMAEQPSRALGTALRPATVRALADEAGFDRCEVLPIRNDLFRFYLMS